MKNIFLNILNKREEIKMKNIEELYERKNGIIYVEKEPFFGKLSNKEAVLVFKNKNGKKGD